MSDGNLTAAPAAAVPTAAPVGGDAGAVAPAPVAAPVGGAPAAAPEQSDGPAARETRGDRFARITAKLEAKRAATAPGAAADAPPAAVDASPVAATSPTGAPAETTPPTNTDPLTPAQRQAMADALRAERESYETKQRAKQLEEENKRFKAEQESRGKLSPLELLAKERGLTYEQLTREIVDGKYKPPTAEQLELQGTKSEVQLLREELDAIKAERANTVKEAEFKGRADVLTTELKQPQHAATYPVLSSYADAGERVQRLKEAHPDASYPDIAAHLEKELRATMSVDALKALATADPNFKSLLLSALGGQSAPPAAQPVPQGKPSVRNGPDAIAATRAADPGARSTPGVSGREARQAAAAAAVRNKRAASLG